MGTRAMAGQDPPPPGEDLKVKDGLAGQSRCGSLCGGETEAREDTGMSGPLSRAKPCPGGRGSKMLRQQRPDLGSSSWTGGVAVGLLQRPCWLCSGRWPGTVSLPPSVPPLGPDTPRVEADVLTRSRQEQPLSPSTSRRLLPACWGGGPAAAPWGKGAEASSLVRRGVAQWEHFWPPQRASTGPSGRTQLELECLVGPSMGKRLLPPPVVVPYPAPLQPASEAPSSEGKVESWGWDCMQTLIQVPAPQTMTERGPLGE